MITIKSEREIALMRESGRVTSEVLDLIGREIRAGMTTLELDTLAEQFIRDNGGVPSFLNYAPKGDPDVTPYPATLCVSINDEVVHGIPSADRVIQEGDIVSVDCGVFKSGYHGDSARTYMIGAVDARVEKLVNVTKECLMRGIAQAVAGNRLHDISAAVEEHARAHGYSVIENMVGHGIGTELHEEPPVPNYGRKHTGVRLKEGMALAIEPMIAMGRSRNAVCRDDDWVAVTEDGSPSAHFEHTIIVRKGKAEIMTLSGPTRN
ncbi:type I methionyl aminopeptidase [Prosthecochloris sp. N3]|uniref:Methionine aminopeptidase n=1 Tax=Prosthecochloris ethylica TaxID=2743976 RepID=A0ABR9XPL8_9CHLB|nr:MULTISPECIES: type I methionyl aminopeptidase [Prosthecochloris]MEC9486454.1 type I methionyl aminopeptidase [Prosthecochloris sp.]MBF0585846.1 type I methionyl aminopeptidase [Prosthecochloris ethylica]MBF0635756.1 type I methionyl aminopeptidase [Prosthecochloris ethylica]NUK47054.1 type I methionyl aminopeptidase [Prosthecochloris ethylica]RNA65533.1 type I methionyl aminopeptidase [Prosthecochloris sp. ZM_2]